MGKIKFLADTDVLIDFLNTGAFSFVLENREVEVYYSSVTRKELLTKPGLSESERKAIIHTLADFRLIPVDGRVAAAYSVLRKTHKRMEKEDALIAATAISRKIPIFTRNRRYYRGIRGLSLLPETIGNGS